MKFRSSEPKLSKRRINHALNDALEETGTFEHPSRGSLSMKYGSWFSTFSLDIFSQITSNHRAKTRPIFTPDTDYLGILAAAVGDLSVVAYGTTEQFRRDKNPNEMAIAQSVGRPVVHHFIENQPRRMDNFFYVFTASLRDATPRNAVQDGIHTSIDEVLPPSKREGMLSTEGAEEMFDKAFVLQIHQDEASFPTEVLRQAAVETARQAGNLQLRAFGASIEEALLAASTPINR